MAVVEAEKANITAARGRRPRLALQSKQTRLAWILLAPTIAVVLFVAGYPLVRTVYQSFTDESFGNPSQFIGWTNYYNMLQDATFRETVFETFKFTLITVVFEFVLGMGIALVVNSHFKGRGALRAAMLVPWAVITVVNAQMWKLMYNSTYGVFNDILVRIHWPGAPIAFLGGDPNLALGSISLIDIWKTTPFVALLLLAGLQVIPNDVYEAATVDGASAWNQFWRITLPLLRPAILVTLIFRTMDALRVFDVFYVLFGQAFCIPGNCNQSMAVFDQGLLSNGSTFIASAHYGALGYGATISVGIFIILAIVIAIYIKAIPLERT
jgi:trehalose/maltose transport system permease protein